MATSHDFKLNGNWAITIPSSGMRIKTQVYQTYAHMVDRTKAGSKVQAKKGNYVGCTNGFEGFQAFADWATKQIGYGVPGYQLDKDLLVKGNKVYSPETCCFLPREINMAIIRDHSGKKSGLPIGVFCNGKNGLAAKINIHGKAVFLSSTPTSTEEDIAHLVQVYEEHKTAYLHALAIEHQLNLDPRAFQALMAL